MNAGADERDEADSAGNDGLELHHMRAFDYVLASRWAITEEALRQIELIALRQNDISAYLAKQGEPLRNAQAAEIIDGTAIVPIVGPIFRYANLFTEISGASSIELIGRDLRVALDDPLVRDILLYVDSPGGNVSGVNELSNYIFQNRAQKPIHAYIANEGNSAAYWLASAAHSIAIDATAVAGSIGARAKIIDTTARDQRSGVRTIDIVSSLSPDKGLEATSDAGRAKIQALVDELGRVFVQTVARNRGVDFDTVARDYGQGWMFVGQHAVAAGLVDRVSSMEQVLAALREDRNSTWRVRTVTTKPSPKGPITVADTAGLRAAVAAGHTPDEIEIAAADPVALRAAAREEIIAEGFVAREAADKGIADARAEATAAAITAERERILAIQDLMPEGYEAIGAAAITAGQSLAEASLALAREQKNRGHVSTEALRAGATRVVAHGGTARAAKPSGVWGKITAQFNGKARA